VFLFFGEVSADPLLLLPEFGGSVSHACFRVLAAARCPDCGQISDNAGDAAKVPRSASCLARCPQRAFSLVARTGLSPAQHRWSARRLKECTVPVAHLGKCRATKAFEYSTQPWVVFSLGRYRHRSR
jgi:hypothetical protein